MSTIKPPPIQEPFRLDENGRLASPPWILWLQSMVAVSEGGTLATGGAYGIKIPHSSLTNVKQADDTSESTELQKHVTDAQVKVYGDHVRVTNGNPHGTNWDQLEETATFIPMNTAPTGVPTTEGTISWNAQDHTLNIQSEIADSILQVGQELWCRGVNKTGSTIANGQAVYVSGAQGNRPKISLADASSEVASYTLGVATADIANNAEGYVTIFGLVRGYNTSGFTDGALLYLSATTPGALTTTRPTAPNHGVQVAIALNSTNNGMIFVHPTIGFELGELHDVSAVSPTYGDFLTWNNTAKYWEKSRKIGDGTNYTEFETDGFWRFNGTATCYEDALLEIVARPSAIHASSGSLGGLANAGTSTGSYASTLLRNGVYWHIEETAGSADDYFISIVNPMIFNGVLQVPTMYWSGGYYGSTTHAASMAWIVYNNSTLAWDALTGTISNAIDVFDAVVTGFTANHINGSGQVKIALRHTSSGTGGHYMNIDEVRLVEDNTPITVAFRGADVPAFRNSGYDKACGKIQFPHRYKEESNYYWHVHFVNHAGAIADGETVTFTLSKSFSEIYGVYPTVSTLTATFTNNSTWRAGLSAAQQAEILSGTSVVQDSHLIAVAASSISGTGLKISSIGMCCVTRGVGTYTGDIAVIYSDFHIEQDTLASRQEFSK